ncbi:MAG: hypothetical protein RIC37_03075 [Gammaproteobacteria bacterium]
MDRHKLLAWVLLSVGDQPRHLGEVLLRADGINKATPSLDELRDSLVWLENAGCIKREGNLFKTTKAAAQLRNACEERSQNLFDLWTLLASELRHLVPQDNGASPLTEVEYDRGINDFRARGAKMLREYFEDDA